LTFFIRSFGRQLSFASRIVSGINMAPLFA
jgi:hypothetical protein